MSTFIKIMRPVVSLLPIVKEPVRKTSYKEKLMWTALALLVFLVCSQVPLVGMKSSNSDDPFHFMRMVMASNRGTLMDLGIGPIVTSSMVLQLLQGAKLISINMSDDEEKQIYEGSQKFFGIIMTLVQGFAYVFSGMYGTPSDLGFFNCLLIITQLLLAGILVLLLDEMLSNGFGFGSAISLFIATNISENIVWSAFSPFTYARGNSNQFEGAIINLFHTIFARPDKLTGLYEVFFRTDGPNLMNLISTVVVFLTVMYFHGFRVDIPLAYKTARVENQTYSIKLFYTSNMPVILYSTFTNNVFMISQMIFRRFPTNFVVRLFGTWSMGMTGSRMQPIGGLCYYLSTPSSFTHLFMNPVHGFISIAITVCVCSFLSREWIKVSGSSSQDVRKQLTEQKVSIKGFRDSESVHYLDKYIPIAASFGGFCIGLLSVAADLLGAVGSGTGILLAATSISDFWNTFQKEYKTEMGMEFNFA